MCDVDDALEEADRAASPVGSDADEGRLRVFCIGGRCADVRIEGLRSLVGGAVVDVEAEDDDSGSDDFRSRSCPLTLPPFSLTFLVLGLGGGLRSRSAFTLTLELCAVLGVWSSSSSSSPSSKSKIFVKLSPTLGELLKSFANSAGVGVARVSPVAVRTTPFIAEGMYVLGTGRVTGVAIDGKA